MEQDIYEELKSIKQYLLLGAKSALNMMQLYLPGCQNLAYIVSSVKNKFLIIKKANQPTLTKKN